ncbi:MAG TPA: cytochrome P450 [Streptosporangiaceae bacterium]
MDAAQLLTELLSPAGRDDPYPRYAQLHELGAATAVPGVVVVVGYDAINGVLRDPAFGAADAELYDQIMPGWRDHPSVSLNGLLTLNPPEHGRIRRLVSREFTSRRIAALAPAIAAMTDSLLAEMAERGAAGRPVEFMHDFAFLLPVTAICELIGIPEADRETFRPLATALVATLEPAITPDQLAAADEAAVQLNDYFTDLAERRREQPRDDLLSALVGVHDADDGRLSSAELLDNLALLLVAGFETTANLLGNGLRIILQDPSIGDELRTGSIPVPAFVEEVLRFDSPVQLTSRRRADPTEIAGVTATPEDEVLLLLGGGNRDPRRFCRPDTFDPARADAGPLSFGGGAHFCLGAALARLEAGVAFPRLLARFPELAPAGAPTRKDTIVLRGYETLPVTVQ